MIVAFLLTALYFVLSWVVCISGVGVGAFGFIAFAGFGLWSLLNAYIVWREKP